MSGPRSSFYKSFGHRDRIAISALGGPGNDWLTISTNEDQPDISREITLRSDEDVHDLHYALGRYIEHLKTDHSK